MLKAFCHLEIMRFRLRNCADRLWSWVARNIERTGTRMASAAVGNLEILARQLWSVGIRDIYADGSFVEDKDHPNDIDGYFVCDLQPLDYGRIGP